jgi:hypothetical protein
MSAYGYGSLESTYSHEATSDEVPPVILNDTNVRIPDISEVRYYYSYPTYPQKTDESTQKQRISIMKKQFSTNKESGKLTNLGKLYIKSNLKLAIGALRAKSREDGESFDTKYQRLVDYIDPTHTESDFFAEVLTKGGKTKRKRRRKSKRR